MLAQCDAERTVRRHPMAGPDAPGSLGAVGMIT
jgi:prephenate dehydrogenase